MFVWKFAVEQNGVNFCTVAISRFDIARPGQKKMEPEGSITLL